MHPAMKLLSTVTYHKEPAQHCPACRWVMLHPGMRVWIARRPDGTEAHVCSELCVRRYSRRQRERLS